MDTLETLICMVYNTKGMVKIDQETAEKIHPKGREVEQAKLIEASVRLSRIWYGPLGCDSVACENKRVNVLRRANSVSDSGVVREAGDKRPSNIWVNVADQDEE